jgi:hypothetical protein
MSLINQSWKSHSNQWLGSAWKWLTKY